MRILKKLTGALVAAAAAVPALLIATPTASADPFSLPITLPGQCAPLSVILVPGTGETNPIAIPELSAGMLTAVGDRVRGRLGGNNVTVRYLPYMATSLPDDGASYRVSLADGKARLRSMIATTSALCPGTTFAIGGYSQGAQIAGDIAAEIGTGHGPIAPERLKSVTLIADPHRGTEGEELMGPPVLGIGSLGPRASFGAVAGRVATFCNAGDKWCSAGEITRKSVGYLYLTAAQGNIPALQQVPQAEPNTPEDERDYAELRTFVATGAASHMSYGADGVRGSNSLIVAGDYIADRR